jgi:hypothetical protein
MFYYAPGPVMWVTPLSAFATPVPPTAYYYTVPQYYVPPPAAPVEPVNYGMPIVYGAPYAPYAPYAPNGPNAPYPYEPYYYPQVAEPKLPRGEYRFGRCLLIC